jgi:aminoglycoside phosphotransferase (APT) family kinase protein
VSSTTQSAVPGVDLAALTGWMESVGLESGRITGARAIGGGTQNIMVRFTRGAREFVLRRGPLHLRRATNDNLRREIRLITALAATDVAHPRLIAACTDESVLGGSVFYLMEPVDGFNAAVELPTLHASNSQVRYQMGLAMVDALAVLAKVDHKSVGLADFGRPEGFLERQVPRWLRELQSYTQLDNYGDHGLPTELVATWLTDNRPATGPIGIMHGDFHIANAMFDIDGPTVAAIVDWEMCTIGDPMLDLGWLLATWPDPDQQQDMIGTALTRAGGLPPREVLIQRYGERTGFDVSAADWYTVLACFKLGIILEGTYARSCAGLAPVDVGRQLHSTAVGLFDRARRFIDRK